MMAPHEYVPDGPVETAPLAGYCRPEIRREAFAAVLEGVHTGTYDERMVEWLVGWDDPTCRTIASLLWRCRLAGRQAMSVRIGWPAVVRQTGRSPGGADTPCPILHVMPVCICAMWSGREWIFSQAASRLPYLGSTVESVA